jgi:hypothetical protein
MPRKDEYRIYAELVQFHPSRRRGTSSRVIPRLQPRERRTAEEKKKSTTTATEKQKF